MTQLTRDTHPGAHLLPSQHVRRNLKNSIHAFIYRILCRLKYSLLPYPIRRIPFTISWLLSALENGGVKTTSEQRHQQLVIILCHCLSNHNKNHGENTSNPCRCIGRIGLCIQCSAHENVGSYKCELSGC